jgi:predicted component of type VI protein secretion system
MPRLYVLSGPEIGRTIDVKDGATIGRAVEAGVQLRDASVSRHHAKLEMREGAWRIVDAGSRNGITLKGARVTDAALEDGDEFQVGEVLLRFRSAAQAAAPAEAMPDEITLEEDPVAELPELAARPPIPVGRPPRPPAAEPATPLERTVANVRRTVQPDPRAKKVLQYHKLENREGLFASDLAQQPAWIKLGAVVLALLVAAAIFLFAFKGTSFLKSKTASPEAVTPASE